MHIQFFIQSQCKHKEVVWLTYSRNIKLFFCTGLFQDQACSPPAPPTGNPASSIIS